MLTRETHTNGLVTYRSGLLSQRGVPHAFSTRIGGLSGGSFASLNLAQSFAGPATEAGDEDPHVERNYNLLQQALKLEGHRLVWCRQVHGCASTFAEASSREIHPEADAALTDQAELLLSIRVADCVPILLAGPGGKAVAAVHAGWRGVVGGVIRSAIRALQARCGVAPRELVAAIGPCISAAHFEVGQEVANAFRQAGLAEAIVTEGYAKPHVDLAAACAAQLRGAGVPENAIDRTDRCTFRDAAEFFSHRRDKGRTGRMAAVIAVAS